MGDSPVLKRCACGAAYTEAEWCVLPLLGVWGHVLDGVLESYEMRNCGCGSSLMVEVDLATGKRSGEVRHG